MVQECDFIGVYSQFSFEKMHRNSFLLGFIQGFYRGQDSILKLNHLFFMHFLLILRNIYGKLWSV